MPLEKDEDLAKFLKDVDEISMLVQGFNSDDPLVREKAFSNADLRIASKPQVEEVEGCRTVVNKMLVNTSPSSQTSPLPPMEEQSQGGFMAALEQDAGERAKKRKENEALANALKAMGNEAFAKGDYETAVLRYSEGLDRLKDMQVLYTNRAQAHIKLEKYKEAITDCEWALRCNETCVKAYVLMGKAYLGLKNYGEAKKCYQKILEIDPKQEKLVKGYLNQVEFNEHKALREQKAQEAFELGKTTAVSVKELLQKLSKPDQMPAYYAGGIRLLIEVMEDCTERTIFRTCNGFNVIGDNKIISRCLETPGKDPLEDDLCIAVVTLWNEVCKGNEENQQALIFLTSAVGCIFNLLLSGVPAIRNECLSLLVHFSQTENGRLLLIDHVDLPRLLQCLLGLVSLSNTQAGVAVGLLASLAVEEKCKIHLRSNFCKTALPSFLDVLRNIKTINPAVVPEFIAVMLSLSVDAGIRRQMAHSAECWDACLATMDKCQAPGQEVDCTDTLVALLSLMVNLGLEPSEVIQERAVKVTSLCLALLSSKNGAILTKSVGVLSRILKHCSLAVAEAVKGGAVKKLIRLLKAGGQITSGYAVKALAACTHSSSQAQEELVMSDKKFSLLIKLLGSENEITAGNAALCLGDCVAVPGAASSLLKSDILKVLLTYARGDAKEVALQQNAAIALGKLCKAEPRIVSVRNRRSCRPKHLERSRLPTTVLISSSDGSCTFFLNNYCGGIWIQLICVLSLLTF
ncbi:tetratricopeptide repeat protein 12-like isoform X2 [Ambystoma mexicanum]|uniref:tetratricopeptide repeat protein 12-like isoform X2 n=1 Tax=Ambystoma mexicanum TaxID=8296 RepID=UPI0037E76CD0